MKNVKGILFFIGLIFLSGCSSDNNPAEETKEILVKTIVINGSDIDNGTAKQLSVVVLPNNAKNRSVTWSVSDESIAVISDTGVLTPLENGTVTVTVLANDESGVSAEKIVIISGVSGPVVLIESITVSGNDITDGQPLQLTNAVLPIDATNKVIIWSVSDTSIASVDNEGLLTPKKNGTITAVASSIDGSGIKGELVITISGISLTNAKAENVLLWQRNNGGWSKYHNDFSGYDRAQTASELVEAKNSKDNTDTTIDNNHTIGEIRILLSAFKATDNIAYLEAAIKGIDYVFEAQYANGGWPQYYPDKSGYRGRITYNDNAMSNVMNLMRDIFLKKNNLELLDESYVVNAQTAFNKGIQVILQTQIVVNGSKTAWCAQHNEVTLEPVIARSYELASNSGSESVGVVRLLMTLENPSTEVIDAINSAVAWFESVKIVGYTLQDTGSDKVLVEAPGNVMWGRFYSLDDYTGYEYASYFNSFDANVPFFCSRDGIPKKTIAEISHERRNGYAWYGSWPKNLIGTEYTSWKNKHGI